MTANRRRQRPTGNAEMEIRAAQRRRAPSYTVVKDWVPACVSAMAGKLYHFYRMHLNRERADGLVWPTMETAAVYLGLSRGDKVTPYMDELETAGAIHATREGQEDGRYLVLVYEDPPDDFDGPVTLTEWYQANRAELDRRRAAAKVKRVARKAAKAARPADTPSTGDPADTPSTGDPDTPSTGDADTPSTGREPLGTEPLGTEPSTSSSPYSSGPAPANPTEEEESSDPEDRKTIAGRILDEVQAAGGAMNGSRLRGRERDQVVSSIADRLSSGWVPAHVIVALEGDLSSVKSVYGTLRYRVQERLAGSPPAAPAPRAAQATERCPTCAPYRPGWIDADPDRPARCHCARPTAGRAWRPGFVSEAVSV
jgi:hypothetical protein